jgi:uncharacterized damage-inducible protein DinB
MINIEEIIRQLTANAEAMRALVQTISEEQAQWKPSPETWSLQEVMGHVYNEERIDFRRHLKELLNDPPKPWGGFRPEEFVSVENCRQALEGIITEREASIAWLKSLESPDWDIKSEVPFGPLPEIITLSAGDVLVSWVEHDFLHIRQMNELLHAWNKKQASPYSVDYAGGW